MAGKLKDAEKSIDDFKNIFAPGDFYLEIADHGVPQQKHGRGGVAEVRRSSST